MLQVAEDTVPVGLAVLDPVEVLITAPQEVLVMQVVTLHLKEIMVELLQVMPQEVREELAVAAEPVQLAETKWMAGPELLPQVLIAHKELAVVAEHKLLDLVDLAEPVAADRVDLEIVMVAQLQLISAAEAADLVHLSQCNVLVVSAEVVLLNY